ncbi:capsular polysaccharide synthesis protein [Roseibium album]|uniref:capsular polysaccharide synthesis protein n=1 Tax=Roseibium album TaxID=311410 RepID=UPI00249106A4|nr:capsular polysaccharide synthesis protein [Roseibium album]
MKLNKHISVPSYVTVKRVFHRFVRGWRWLRQLFGGRTPARVQTLPRPLPKRIWLYWHQGEGAAPPLVQRCIRSWREVNPGWEVVVLDSTSHHDWIDMPELPDTISLNHYANILRVSLLERYGGVWADSTIFCARPLQDWLPFLTSQSGFFTFSWIPQDRAFLGGGPGRTIGNWFLASEPGGTIISAWAQTTRNYWVARKEAKYYFWHNDSFEWLLIANRSVRRGWQRTPRMGALSPHLASHYLTSGEDDEEIRDVLASGVIPLHKLSWRMETPIEEIEKLLLPQRQD